MILEMKVPSPGESITEVEIAQWLVADGDYVEKDQAIAEVDSDKATLELPAEVSGTISLKADEGAAWRRLEAVGRVDHQLGTGLHGHLNGLRQVRATHGTGIGAMLGLIDHHLGDHGPRPRVFWGQGRQMAL